MPHIFNIVPHGFAFRSSREDLGGLKLTRDLRDENTWIYSYFLIRFQICGLILYFFVCVSGWGCLFPYWDLCFCFLVVFFCFGFPFCLCVSVLGLFSPIFVVVVVVLWFFCFYQPPYIFDSPLHLNPTTGEHFKTPLKISSQISNRPGKK